MKRILLLLLLSVLLFTSCSSLETSSVFSEQRLPAWVRNPRVRSGRIAYVAEGSGTSEDSARLNAIENILFELSDDLGWDAYSSYYRELGSSGSVADLDGSIKETYSREYRGGRFSCYILFDISEDAFLSMQSPELVESLRRGEEILSLMEEAKESYMENRDVDAISCALKALSLSLDGDVSDPGLSHSEILSTLLYYTEALEIDVSQHGDGMEASISVRRNRGLLSPLVYSAPIEGSYWIRDTNGVLKEEKISFNTASGSYDYVNTNPYALMNGSVNLSLDIDEDLIDEIVQKAEEGFLDSFITLLDAKCVSYSYDERGDERSDLYDILIAQYDINGARIESNTALKSFNATLSDANRSISAIAAEGDEEEEILSLFLSEGDVKRYVVIMRIGVSESIMIDEERYIVNVHTNTSTYDTVEDFLISSDDSVSSVGYGATFEEASDDAFRNAGRILADVFLIELE